MRKNASLLLLLLFGVVSGLRAQQSAVRRNWGAENVRLDSATNTVFYEQRLYRNPMEGLVRMRRACPDSSACGMVPLLQGVPVGVYRLKDQVDYRPLSSAERLTYRQENRFRPFKYLFDFRIHPDFVADFGGIEQPLRGRFTILLQSQLYLWRGMALNYGLQIPVVNSLDTRPDILRPGPISLNQFLALGNHNFLSASAGSFRNDRYGVNVQYQHANLGSRWTYGLEAGLTGFYYYPRGGIYYDPMDELLLLGNAAYRFTKLDLSAKLTAGRFLAGDWGARADVVRQFDNVEISFFAVKTQNGATIGFNFAVPIPPGKIARVGQVRLRTTEEFRWEYAYAGYNIGNRYRVGYQLDERLRQYHQDYLDKQWGRLQVVKP